MSLYEDLTAEECGVTAWCQKPETVHIFFTALTGPDIMCTFVSYSDTFSELQERARDAFIEAFRPTTLMEKTYHGDKKELGFLCNSRGITVTTYGYGDRYQCFFTRNVECGSHYIECRILESDEWSQLSTFDKTIKWAVDLDTQIKNSIIKNKVQLRPINEDQM